MDFEGERLAEIEVAERRVVGLEEEVRVGEEVLGKRVEEVGVLKADGVR